MIESHNYKAKLLQKRKINKKIFISFPSLFQILKKGETSNTCEPTHFLPQKNCYFCVFLFIDGMTPCNPIYERDETINKFFLIHIKKINVQIFDISFFLSLS